MKPILFKNYFQMVLIFILLFFFVNGCYKNGLYDDKYVKSKLLSLSELATTQYHIKKIVTFEDEKIYGDRKILFEVSAIVKAGIDLNEIDLKTINKNTISIHLPNPKIIVLNIPPGKIMQVKNYVGFFRTDFKEKEKDRVLQLGEKDIRKKILTTNILSESKNNAKIIIENYLKLLGFDNVEIG